MIDFASVHYLGWRHPSASLPSWQQISRSLPAAMGEHPAALRAAAQLARLQGCQDALLAPSTLHLFWDLFGGATLQSLFGERPAIYLDSRAYPIAGWGVERAAAHGAHVQRVPHHDPQALRELLRRRPPGMRPVVVCDGVSACCGQPAPLRAYLQALPRDGWLVVDDTQALGLLGARPSPAQPYGYGGGGSLRWHGLQDERILLVSSLAKGFGAPLAALSGSRERIAAFRRASLTRLHCSPPSVPAALAAGQALALNARCGDRARRRLARLVQVFRSELQRWGISPQPGLFPVQSLHLPPGAALESIQQRLQQAGLQAVLRRCERRAAPCLSCVINARHTPEEVGYAARVLAAMIREIGNAVDAPTAGR